MANTTLTASIIAKEALVILENELGVLQDLHRAPEEEFNNTVNGYKIGATVTIRRPADFTVRSGATLSVQDVIEGNTTLTIDQQIGVDTAVTSAELALSLSSFSDQILKPQINLLANYVDNYILSNAYKSAFNTVGTPGTTPTALSTYLDAGAKLDQFSCPRDGQRALILGPQSQANIVDALKGLFNRSGKISSQYDDAEMGENVAGFNWAMDQQVATHQVGPLGGTPLVNGASQTGATLVTDGWTAAAASRLKQGDVFTVAGVYAVNPVSKASTGVLQQFVVTADKSSDASGNITIPISPSIVTSGAQQTVSGSPADNAALTVLGAANTLTAQNMAWHKSAIALAFAELQKPAGVDMASVKTDPDSGISMRFVRYYDGDNDKFKCRFDLLFGLAVLRPDWIVRIAGGAA